MKLMWDRSSLPVRGCYYGQCLSVNHPHFASVDTEIPRVCGWSPSPGSRREKKLGGRHCFCLRNPTEPYLCLSLSDFTDTKHFNRTWPEVHTPSGPAVAVINVLPLQHRPFSRHSPQPQGSQQSLGSTTCQWGRRGCHCTVLVRRLRLVMVEQGVNSPPPSATVAALTSWGLPSPWGSMVPEPTWGAGNSLGRMGQVSL